MQLRQAVQRFRPFLLGVVAPIAAYFGLHALGIGDLPALLVGGGVAAVCVLASAVIERRVRALPIFVCVLFALTAAVAFATHDARVFLLRASVVSASIGLYLVLLALSRPLLERALKPLIARGSDERAARWRRAWAEQPALRGRLRLACGLSGALLIAEAAARTAIVLRFTIGQSLFLGHAPGIVAVVAIGLILRFVVTPAVVRAMAEPGAGD